MTQGTTKPTSLSGDIFGGITAAIVALPLALAFGIQSGLGPEYGLYGAIFIGFFAAIFGGTAVQISGPTGPMAVVTYAAVLAMIAATGGKEAAWPFLIVTFVLAGLIQIGMGLTGVGKLIKFIPYPVVSGFMSGIGVIIITVQLFPSVGLKNPGKTTDVLANIGDLFTGLNPAALATTAATMVVIYTFPKLTKAVPSVLVALLVVTIVTVVAGINVPTIGDIPKGFPEFNLPNFSAIDASLWPTIIKFAAMLAALGAIDSLLTSVVADNMTKTRHNSKRELIGQGIGNTISGMFGGLPGAGATMRTVVNVKAGGKTRLSGVIHSVVLLFVLLGAGAYAAYIPKAVLAGILFTVGIGILDYRGLRSFSKIPRSDAVVMLVVLCVTVFYDLIWAVAIGVLMSMLVAYMRWQRAAGVRSQTEELPGGLFVKRIASELYFGTASDFQMEVTGANDAQHVIIGLEGVPFIDQTGAYALEEALNQLGKRDITVSVSGLAEQPAELLRDLEIVPKRLPNERVFERIEDAIASAQAGASKT